MKRLYCVAFIFFMLIVGVAAQDNTPTATPTVPAPFATAEATSEADEPFTGRATVNVVSAFVRAEPSELAEPAASVYEDDVLEVIGRNIDGAWFEVKRPGRVFNLGWIYSQLLDYDFQPEDLPMTSNEVIPYEDDEAIPEGEERATVEDTGFAVFITQEANLRDAPFTSGGILAIIPHSTILPVIARDSEATWLLVNYRGIEGWVSNINFRRPDNIGEIPEYIVPGVPVIAAEIIPIEIQLGQLQAFRTYVQDSYDVAFGLVDFWYAVADGEVMPCNPPPFVEEYLYTPRDVRELPELDRFAPRFNTAIENLNDAIEPLYICGILDKDVAIDARNSAINASIIFDVTLTNLANLEDVIVGDD